MNLTRTDFAKIGTSVDHWLKKMESPMTEIALPHPERGPR